MFNQLYRITTTFVLVLVISILPGCGGGGGGGVSVKSSISSVSDVREGENAVAKALCGTTAYQYSATAKSYLFKAVVTEQDYQAAKSAVSSSLSSNANCPDAQMLSAIIELIGETDRVFTNVFEGTDTIFPFGNSFIEAVGLSRVTGPVLMSLPRHSAKLNNNSSPSDAQTEIKNTLPLLEGVLQKLETVNAKVSPYKEWGLTFAKNPDKPQLGYEEIDGSDVMLLKGAIQFAIGVMYYAISYNLNCPDTFKGCRSNKFKSFYLESTADKDNNKILTPSEYFPPAPFGTLVSGGTTYLTKAKTNISGGLSSIYDAVTNITLETEATAGGIGVGSALLKDVKQYKHFISDFAKSFDGTTTDIVVPKTIACYNELMVLFDPSYRSDQAIKCSSTFDMTDEHTVPLNIGALFSLSDLRDVMQNYTLDEDGTAIPSSSFTGSTLGGLVPGGLKREWFDVRHVYYNLQFVNLRNSSTGNVISTLPAASSISLTFGGKSLSAFSVSASSTNNSISFYNNRDNTANYLQYNILYGVELVLKVTGYKDKTINAYIDNWGSVYTHTYFRDISLTPN